MRIPEWYRIEIGHAIDRWREGLRDQSWRDRINDNPSTVVIVTAVFLGLFLLVLMLPSKSNESYQQWPSRRAWFYDTNTGKLFLVSSREVGPIEAPSGDRPDGTRVGFRAHVYSYVLDPNDSELFVGFLERPLEGKKDKVSVQDMENESVWVKTRMIKRPKDDAWVRANSLKGREILDALSRPNHRGQTPIYQIPK